MLMDRRWILPSLMALALLQFTGCPLLGGNNAEKPAEEAVGEEGEEEPAANEAKAVFDIKPKPVVESYRPLSVPTADGLKLEATLYIPGLSPYKPPVVDEESGGEEASEEEGEAKPKAKVKPAKVQYPLVILLHSLSSSRWEWKEYPRHLLNAGYAVLAMDMRGHGDSVYKGKSLNVWRQFDEASWQKLAEDPQVLLDYIAQQPEFNMVNTHNLGLIGSSLGANVAVNYASKHPSAVKAIVLLSPGLEYHGIETFDAMTHYENPVYFLASSDDAYSADSVKRLYKFALGKKKIKIFEDLGHGIDMMTKNPDLGKDMRDWLVRMLPPVGGGPVVEDATEATDTKTSEKPGKDATKGEKEASGKEDSKKVDSKDGASKKPNSFVDPTHPKEVMAKPGAKATETKATEGAEKTTPEKPAEKLEPIKLPVVRKKPVVKPAVVKPVPAEKPAATTAAPATPEPSHAAPPPPPPPEPGGN